MSSSVVIQKGEVADFYANKNVLITGSTGFLGKVLLQKLLLICPNVGNIYLMVRQKKDQSGEDKINKMLENPVFNKLKELHPDFRKKLFIIMGDMGYENLGLMPEDRKVLTEEINIIFHAAASVKFDEELKIAVNTSVRGTRELIAFCKEIKNLNCLMYVSTAYSFCTKNVIKESFYDPPMDPDLLIKLVNGIDENMLNKMAPNILDQWPNTYTFAKAVAENYIYESHKTMPIGLFRPSIVLVTYKEPVECWIDNLNGPIGFIAGIASGLLHVVYAKKDSNLDMVPVDYCINALLVATISTAKQYEMKLPEKDIIFNYVATPSKSITPKKFRELCSKDFKDKLENTVGPIYCIIVGCKYWYAILEIFTHFLPAFIMDGFLILKNKKPRMLNIRNKIYKYNSTLKFFSNNNWEFVNDNVKQLWNRLSPEEKQTYPFSMNEIDLDEYYLHVPHSLKKFIMKDDMSPESVEAANRRYSRMMRKVKFFTAVSMLILILIMIFALPRNIGSIYFVSALFILAVYFKRNVNIILD